VSINNLNEKSKIRFDVLIEFDEEEQVWTARCLQMNLLVDGDTIEEVKKNIRDCVTDYIQIAIEKGITQEMFIPAPKKYWDKVAEIERRMVRRKRTVDVEKLHGELERLSESRKKDSSYLYDWEYAEATSR
jgi:predicted RNase H-like HicB family nuclease